MRHRIAGMIVAALVLTLAPAIVAGTAPPAAAITLRWRGSDFRSWSTGHHLGPSQWTDGGRADLLGYARAGCMRCRAKRYDPIRSFSHPDPTIPLGMALDSWWNPLSWDWGHILRVVWDDFQDCYRGALDGVMPALSGTLAINMLFRGAQLYVGPYGYASIAVGGCVWAIVKGGG